MSACADRSCRRRDRASVDAFPARRAWPTRAVEALFAESVSARQGLPLSQRRVYPLRTGSPRAAGSPAQDGLATRTGPTPGPADPRMIPAHPPARRLKSRQGNMMSACADRSCRRRERASADAFPARRAWPTRAVEALFAERVSARQGLPLSQRRVHPLRTGSPRAAGSPAQDGLATRGGFTRSGWAGHAHRPHAGSGRSAHDPGAGRARHARRVHPLRMGWPRATAPRRAWPHSADADRCPPARGRALPLPRRLLGRVGEGAPTARAGPSHERPTLPQASLREG
jgi:hypothetical protein